MEEAWLNGGTGMLAVTIMIAGAAVVAWCTVARVKGPSVRALLLKAAAGLLFVAAWVAAAAALPSAQFGLGLMVILGLVFGLVGDIWLDLAELAARSHDAFFLAGMATFGVGHCFFIVGMVWTWHPAWGSIAGAAATAAAVPAVVFALERKLGLDFGRFRVPAMAYGYLLALTACVGLFTAFGGGAVIGQALAMGIGAILFLVSDLVLCGANFGEHHGKPSAQIACYVFYYAAQFTMALSLLAVRGA
ncbi:MAG: lysoplasmalogenase [Bifidobacteriaceae bacterium]|jgi:hypothetical protein|nr:lysoplasmalogenase [Bifidobacteriaceae bacterium]